MNKNFLETLLKTKNLVFVLDRFKKKNISIFGKRKIPKAFIMTAKEKILS